MVPSSADSPTAPARPRLQKVLAAAGFGSRRQCEALIVDGRVEIDRKVVTELGTRVDPSGQQIRVDGDVVKPPRQKCFVLNKPVGVVSTARDPWARTRVIDLVDDPDRLFTVGRLDKSSSGLILVTNDGDLAQRLTHPSYGVEKIYQVTVVGKPSAEALQQIRRGIHFAEGKARVARVSFKRANANHSTLEIVLTEGRNREIRRLLARIGHKVQQLKRIAIGTVRLGDLPTGAYRELTRQELSRLRRSAEEGAGKGGKKPKGRGKPASAEPRPSGGRQRSAGRSERGVGPRQGTVLGADAGSSRQPRKSGTRKTSGTRQTKRSTPRRPAKRK